MTAYKDRSREELLQEKELLEAKFQEIKGKGLKLDMSRGKPSEAQLNLSMGMMDVLNSTTDLRCSVGVDCRNYGVLDGIPEAKELLADMTEVSPDNIIRKLQSERNVRYRSPFHDSWRVRKHSLVQVGRGKIPLSGTWL